VPDVQQLEREPKVGDAVWVRFDRRASWQAGVVSRVLWGCDVEVEAHPGVVFLRRRAGKQRGLRWDFGGGERA
jgi:hypothetical protein